MSEPATLAAARPGLQSAANATAPGSRHGPIVVLTYPHAGAETLADALAASPALVCTQGTGLLPLCHSALATWRKVESRGTEPSSLAIKSARTMVASMAMVVQSRTGATRWCETATAGPAVAETFARVFPEATFLCVHRSLRGVLAEGLSAYPWGLGGSPFWPHADGHAGNSVATIAAYWAASTEALLGFEEAHPQSCLRVRQEDLAADPRGCAAGLFASLGLDPGDLALAGEPAEGGTARPDAGGPQAGTDPEPPIADLVPQQLLARVRDLHARLDYLLP